MNFGPPLFGQMLMMMMLMFFFFLHIRQCRRRVVAGLKTFSRASREVPGFRDGAQGFHADPTPQTACSVIGTGPGVSMQTHPKLPGGPQANLVAHPRAPLSASCAWPSSWPSAEPSALFRARGLRR